jgi:ribosomal-protein-alanine N-acetyltransferase
MPAGVAIRHPGAHMAYPDLYPVRLVGEHVILRELQPEQDAAAAFVFGSDPEFFRYLPHEPETTQEEELGFLSRLQRAARARPRREYHLGVQMKEIDELVGMARLTISVPNHRGGDIGYGIRPDQWGRGLATEAARLIVGFGFERLALHRISAVHHPENLASGRVLQKVGMQREGRLRENLLAHGAWRDSVAYAILDREWHPGPRGAS